MKGDTVKKRHARPISLTEVVKGQLLALSKVRPEASSVELTRNAKGDTQIKVSVSAQEGESIAGTAVRAQEVYDGLAKRYPAPKPS